MSSLSTFLFFTSLVLTLNLSNLNSAFAQVDATSSLLMNQGTKESISPNLDSGRYTVRQPQNPRNVKSEKDPNKIDELKNKIKAKVTEEKQEQEQEQQRAGQPSSVLSPELVQQPQTTEEFERKKDVVDALRDAVLGGDQDSISKYKDQLHPEDPRQNIMNLSVAPSYLYFNSSSSYWFRDYHSSGPGLALAADIWLTPFMGIQGEYVTTLAADINAEPTTSRAVLVDHRYTTAGFVFRNYTSQSRRSPWFIFGVKYSEYQMIVPRAEANRIRLTTKGIAFSFESHWPTAVNTSWYYGIQLIPKTKTTEDQTAIQVQSGTDPTSYATKLSLGREFSFDRKNQMFWQLSHRVDKTIYKGAANTNDPITGTMPQGVTVTLGATVLELGYTWGD